VDFTLPLRIPDVFEVYVHLYSWILSVTYLLYCWAVSSIPLDLRIIHHPLHTRLSPSSAGFPMDEAANIRVVRDDWVRNSAWNTCMDGSALCKQNIRYRRFLSISILMYSEVPTRIHMGTFNVNGKSPSQDLSPWIASQLESQLSKETPVDQDDGETKSSPSQPRSPLRNLLYLGTVDIVSQFGEYLS
jgi:hypothetical protein